MTDDTTRGGPLSGVLVADFSRILAGPYATMLLADLGADVIKVEGPKGDDTRTWTPPARGDAATY
jgi:crotonobetainyl-CoA:carnitine CoA-transferase CaiB-like acyl-CoA transferase